MHERKTVICIVLISLLLYSLYTLSSARLTLAQLKQEEAVMRVEYARLLEQNSALNDELSRCGSDETMERLAREKLGLVYPGEIVFYFIHTDRED